MEDVIIIGAGLAGLSTAYQLKKENINFKILESQNRTGGRIETILGNQNTPMEMGATWFSKEHHQLIQFLSELNIGYFEQYNEGISIYETEEYERPQQYQIPPNTHSAYRIQGGTTKIIDTLYQIIGKENVFFNTQIISIRTEEEHVKLTDKLGNIFLCKQLIIAIPPKLIASGIQISPPLPQALNKVLQQTQTWMSSSTKFAVEYKKPFWIEKGYSGTVYSQTGLAVEVYDHNNVEHTKFALKGFLNSSAIYLSFEERKEIVISQLKSYFGNEAADFISYHDKIWNDKFIQPDEDTLLPPHLNNGHAVFQEGYLNNKLFFTGTETSHIHPGYMEGAIVAAKSVAHKLIEIIKK